MIGKYFKLKKILIKLSTYIMCLILLIISILFIIEIIELNFFIGSTGIIATIICLLISWKFSLNEKILKNEINFLLLGFQIITFLSTKQKVKSSELEKMFGYNTLEAAEELAQRKLIKRYEQLENINNTVIIHVYFSLGE